MRELDSPGTALCPESFPRRKGFLAAPCCFGSASSGVKWKSVDQQILWFSKAAVPEAKRRARINLLQDLCPNSQGPLCFFYRSDAKRHCQFGKENQSVPFFRFPFTQEVLQQHACPNIWCTKFKSMVRFPKILPWSHVPASEVSICQHCWRSPTMDRAQSCFLSPLASAEVSLVSWSSPWISYHGNGNIPNKLQLSERDGLWKTVKLKTVLTTDPQKRCI